MVLESPNSVLKKKLFLNCRFDPPFWDAEFLGLQFVWKFDKRRFDPPFWDEEFRGLQCVWRRDTMDTLDTVAPQAGIRHAQN
jgi:hypothetical protein